MPKAGQIAILTRKAKAGLQRKGISHICMTTWIWGAIRLTALGQLIAGLWRDLDSDAAGDCQTHPVNRGAVVLVRAGTKPHTGRKGR